MDVNVKITNLIKNARKFEDMQFRLLLEELVKQGGRESEGLLSQMALSDSNDDRVRINIIRSMGYINSTGFLMTLRKILEGSENLMLRKAAIISISKYNDNRALNMLNSALKRINNPILQDSISTEISRIKKDNPILGLMPKFLNGVNDPKTFRTTLEILKKILNPSDAQVFIYHLNSDIPFVGDGAFEVLCWRGDDSVKFSIFDFFRKKLAMIDCIGEFECISLQDLLSKLEKFITRNPHTINYILKEIKDIYKETSDIKVKDILINMFSSSRKREVLSFLEDIYNTEPGRRELIIEKLRGNEEGAYILIYKYKKDAELKETLLLALMNSRAGADYISGIFDSLSPGYQNLVLQNIDADNYIFFEALLERFLASNDYGHKKFALDNMRKNQDTRFQSILFDPEYEDEFLRMQSDYIEAISELFFIQTFKVLFNKIIKMDTARPLIRKYLKQKNLFILSEPVIKLTHADDLTGFVNTLVKFNYKELNLEILEIFCSLKTFDTPSYSKLLGFLEEFKNARGARLSQEERGVLNRVKSNFQNIGGDIKMVEAGNANINRFIEKEFPDYDLLEYVLKNHHLAFFGQREKVIERIRKVFKLTNDIDAFDAIKFFLRRPEFCMYFKEEIKQATESSNYLLKNDADKLMETMPKDIRFVLRFDNTLMYACFENQLQEIAPEFEVTRTIDLLPTDILITDTELLKTLAVENRLNTQKLFVLLKDKEEFASIKEFNPKVFPPPLSFYKVIKAVIPVLFPAGGEEEKTVQ